jgi:hypothetical protein
MCFVNACRCVPAAPILPVQRHVLMKSVSVCQVSSDNSDLH